MLASTGPRLLSLLAGTALPRRLTPKSSSSTIQAQLLLLVPGDPILSVLLERRGRDSGEELLDLSKPVHVR